MTKRDLTPDEIKAYAAISRAAEDLRRAEARALCGPVAYEFEIAGESVSCSPREEITIRKDSTADKSAANWCTIFEGSAAELVRLIDAAALPRQP